MKLKMKIVVNAFLVQRILCYFRYFLQLMLVELLFIMFIHNGIKKKKDSPHVDFNTNTQTDVTEHINGKNQKN